MRIKIYTMTHKKFDIPSDPMYIPLQVGSACTESLGYLGDDTGDNISTMNCYYSELTGVYWVWKNVHDADYVGICHYRRFLLNDQGFVLNSMEIHDLLAKYDMITTKRLTLNYSYLYGFGENHCPNDLILTGKVIKELYPDFHPVYEKKVMENHTYFGNIMICSKPLFDEYCAFLFPIFTKLHTMLDLDSYDAYHKRLYGFISEFLLMVWCDYRKLKVKECKVGIIGAKKETTEVKEQLAKFFRKKDWQGAGEYFLQVRKLRPDILMEASDIHWELHLALQVIATAQEDASFLDHINDFAQLMDFMRSLNHIVQRTASGELTLDDQRFLNLPIVTNAAIKIAVTLYGPQDETKRKNLLDLLLQKASLNPASR